jgi:hypothetical protein
MITTDIITIAVTDLIVGHNYRTTVIVQNTSNYYVELDRNTVDFIANSTSKNLLFCLKKNAELNIILLETSTTDLDTGKTKLENTIWLCPTPTPTVTQSATSTPNPSQTPTPTATTTLTASLTPTATATQTVGASPTPTRTPTPTPSITPSITPVSTGTPTSTPTNTSTGVPTATPTRTPTHTPVIAASQTPTPTRTPTATPAPTRTATQTATASATKTPTPTPSVTPGFCLTFCSPSDIATRYGLSAVAGYASIREDAVTIAHIRSIENAKRLDVGLVSPVVSCGPYTGRTNYPIPANNYHWYWNGSAWVSSTATGFSWIGTMKVCLLTVPRVDATGGNITYCNGYKIHTFLTAGSDEFNITSLDPNAVFEILLVGGGGGGGSGAKAAGGGGGGGVIHNTSFKFPSVGKYDITVGTGALVVAKGSDSKIVGPSVNLIAIGGGSGGDGEGGIYRGPAGNPGGCGGGGGIRSDVGPGGLGTVGQGTRGGSARNGNWIAGGGGGGSLSAGFAGSGSSGSTIGGNGGNGKLIDISCTAKRYGGGGGGSGENNGSSGGTPGTGGLGGGGRGGNPGVAGTANTGGGGGGGGVSGTTRGGSGIVIIRYWSNESPVPLK